MTIKEALIWLKKNTDEDIWIDLFPSKEGEYGPTRVVYLAHIFLERLDDDASSVKLSWISEGQRHESDLAGLVEFHKTVLP